MSEWRPRSTVGMRERMIERGRERLAAFNAAQRAAVQPDTAPALVRRPAASAPAAKIPRQPADLLAWFGVGGFQRDDFWASNAYILESLFTEAQTAFRNQAKAHHPDRPGGSAERFTQINEAWNRLRRQFAARGIPHAPAPAERTSPMRAPRPRRPVVRSVYFELSDAVAAATGFTKRAFFTARRNGWTSKYPRFIAGRRAMYDAAVAILRQRGATEAQIQSFLQPSANHKTV